MHTAVRAYNVITASVLSFVGNVEVLRDSWEEYEARACRILFRGPTGWMQPGCLRALKHLGFPLELPDMRCHTTAAKCRVMKYEDSVRGGLQVSAKGPCAGHASESLRVQLARVLAWMGSAFLLAQHLWRAHAVGDHGAYLGGSTPAGGGGSGYAGIQMAAGLLPSSATRAR